MRVTEREIIQYLQRAGDQFAPLTINRLEEQVTLTEGYRADAIIDFSIQDGPSFEALVEIAPVPTPKNVLEKSRQLADYMSKSNKPNIIPVVIAPYIGKRQGQILADKGISWMDISGNMSIRVSNQIYIERTGQRNRFPDTAPIKKIFQGTSSLVSRALLLKPEGFSSLYEVVDFINERNANITLSTVSKVLKSLEEELLINRSGPLISVTNIEKLLTRLTEGYINSTERKKRKTYKFAAESSQKLFFSFYERQIDYVACGFYAAQIKGLAVTDQITIFVTDIEQVKKASWNNCIKITPDAEFGNVSITEVKDPGVWFNVPLPMYNRDVVVDDIELYLEMMVDTPRGPKIAEQLKRRILEKADISG
ncbi:MAG TPA: hypothetical protein VMW72_16395 [Sedimentisphaerales bacterium]|nr:hypothetical protein [Sedimentisphaerales bacterium]